MPYEKVKEMNVGEFVQKLSENKSKLKCFFCGNHFSLKDLKGFNYEHSEGIPMKELGKIWLSLNCKKCGLDTAIHKLKIKGLE